MGRTSVTIYIYIMRVTKLLAKSPGPPSTVLQDHGLVGVPCYKVPLKYIEHGVYGDLILFFGKAMFYVVKRDYSFGAMSFSHYITVTITQGTSKNMHPCPEQSAHWCLLKATPSIPRQDFRFWA